MSSSSSSSSSSSDPSAADETSVSTTTSESQSKIHSAIQSLCSVLPSPLPSSLSSSTFSLLHELEIATHISALLRDSNSGSGDNNLCRWFYNTFQSGVPDLQLLVLRFVPAITGIYLSRISHHTPLAGFEAVLLALYAHETTSRNGQALTITIPDLSHPSVYHESKSPTKNATELSLAVISPSLEPHGTVRSTRRARIVGVALELYYSKISQMPIGSKIEFCEFCKIWAGDDGCSFKEGEIDRNKTGRIHVPWELLQPILRILGHCIMGDHENKELIEAAAEACRSLHSRSVHEINPKAILATSSLLRLSKMEREEKHDFDPTEISINNVITI